MRENDQISLFTTGKEADDGSPDDNMGSSPIKVVRASESQPLYPNIALKLETSKYFITGEIRLEKVILP